VLLPLALVGSSSSNSSSLCIWFMCVER